MRKGAVLGRARRKRRKLRTADTARQDYSAAVITQSQAAPIDETETPQGGSGFGQLCVAASLVLLAAVAWIVAHGNYYTPRSGLGFNLGVIGGLMMLLTLLGYPLRKHMQRMQRWGAIKHWFRLHMFFGIIGPTLVVFHTAFQVRSLNAGVALGSMLLVVASGLIGRYLYAQIHFGLYGHRATLQRLQEEFSASSGDARSRLHFAPWVERWLRRFEISATKTQRRFPFSFFWFLTLGIRRKMLEVRCGQELQLAMANGKRREFPGGVPEAMELVATYLKGVQRVGQFTHYERIFSLWHVVHIPLIYILVASSVVHVVAVYMY